MEHPELVNENNAAVKMLRFRISIFVCFSGQETCLNEEVRDEYWSESLWSFYF